jgi:hypothetical protein
MIRQALEFKKCNSVEMILLEFPLLDTVEADWLERPFQEEEVY